MNFFIEMINQWGGRFADFAWPMLWQSGLLIVVLFAVDLLSRRKIRASIRYALWLVVLVKLCLPPTLALPTSPAWWLHTHSPAVKPQLHYTVTYDSQPMPEIPQRPTAVYVPAEPTMTGTAWCLAASGIISILLLTGLLLRWGHISRRVRHAIPSERLTTILNRARHSSDKKPTVPVKVTGHSLSPAVCGLLRPTILIPQSLAERFSDEQLRVVLLHEWLHLRRRDVWVNFLQALLQIVYWWHPLLWLANARIRRVREEAVDDAVMLALRKDASSYPPTLLEVAKLALNRPLAGLGLVGILESRSALRQRIERLVNFRAPRKAGLTFASLLGICVFSAVALPMGQAPASASDGFSAAATSAEETLTLKVNPKVFLRNIKAQADWRLDAPTDSWTKILLDIMRSATVDCSPPHGIAFNEKTGEITTRNTPERLKIFRQVIEQLNRPDGLFEMPDIPRRKILIEARCFWMSSDDHGKLVADLPSERGKNEHTPHWIISPEQFTEINQRIASLNLHPFLRPRVRTGDGLAAEFWLGNKQNGVEFDCVPYVADEGLQNGHKGIALVFRARTIATPTGPKHELAGTKQYEASGEVGVEDGGGFIVSAKTPDGSPTNVVTVIQVEIVTNTSPVPVRQRLQTIIKRTRADAASQSGTLVQDGKLLYEMGKFDKAEKSLKSALALEPENQTAHYYMNLVQAAENTPATALKTLTFRLNHPVRESELKDALQAAGVTIPTTAYFYTDAGMLVVHGPEAQLARVKQMVLKLNGFSAKKIRASDAALAGDRPVPAVADENPTNLFSRTFKVSAYIFTDAARNIPGLETNDTTTIARSLFSKMGVDWKMPEGKSVMYNHRLGLLFVRATESDLDTAEKVIEALNETAPQIHIKARFMEVPKGTFDWFSKFIRITNRSSQIVGILPGQNAAVALRTLQSRSDVKELAAPEVTTTSGRQTEMRATVLQTIITNFAYREKSGVSEIFPQTNAVETGPVLDIIPFVLADDRTINLTAIASVTKFLGRDKKTNTIAGYNQAGQTVNLPTISTSFEVRNADAHVNLWDGQTLVLGLNNHFYDAGKEVGAEPGYFATTDRNRGQLNEGDKELLVFITATLVDRAGNRFHSAKDMPFAKDSIPPQDSP